jgi:DNA polymerase III epsilon subunit-like protein
MKIPNAENAFIDREKLRDYCLSREHPRGRHKARVFASALGLTADDTEQLHDALLDAIRSDENFPRVVSCFVR